jgi:hypothetical protein
MSDANGVANETLVRLPDPGPFGRRVRDADLTLGERTANDQGGERLTPAAQVTLAHPVAVGDQCLRASSGQITSETERSVKSDRSGIVIIDSQPEVR